MGSELVSFIFLEVGLEDAELLLVGDCKRDNRREQGVLDDSLGLSRLLVLRQRDPQTDQVFMRFLVVLHKVLPLLESARTPIDRTLFEVKFRLLSISLSSGLDNAKLVFCLLNLTGLVFLLLGEFGGNELISLFL